LTFDLFGSLMDLYLVLTEELAVKWHIICIIAAKINNFNNLSFLVSRLAISIMSFRVRVISSRL
jgi:hypothetical protein